MENKTQAKKLQGRVVSDKMENTVVVLISNFKKHRKYGKYITVHKRIQAHNPDNTYNVGDMVIIEECVPISKHKKFIIKNKI